MRMLAQAGDKYSNVTLFVDGKTKFQFSMHTKKEYIKLATLQAERALKILATHNSSHCVLTKCETKSSCQTHGREMLKRRNAEMRCVCV